MKNLKLIKKDEGQSLVEFAIILPIFLLLVVAIIDFGWIFYNQTRMTNAAREGARVYAVDSTILDTEVEAITEAYLGTWNFSTGPDADATKQVVVGVSDKVAYVEVTATVKPLTGLLQGSVLNLKAKAYMRLEYRE